MPDFTRRDFLKLSTRGLMWLSGLTGLAGLLRFLSFEPDPPPPQQFNVGSADLFLMDTRTIIKEIPAILIRSESGFSALSLTCQHLGCTVEAKQGEFVCPCHGSRYAQNGSVLNGPALKGLKNLKVDVTPENNIIISKS